MVLTQQPKLEIEDYFRRTIPPLQRGNTKFVFRQVGIDPWDDMQVFGILCLGMMSECFRLTGFHNSLQKEVDPCIYSIMFSQLLFTQS